MVWMGGMAAVALLVVFGLFQGIGAHTVLHWSGIKGARTYHGGFKIGQPP